MVAGNAQIMANVAPNPTLEASFCKRKLNTGMTDSSRCSLLTRMLSTPSDPGHTTGTSEHWTSDYHSSRTSTPTPPPSATLDHAPVGILQGYVLHEGSGYDTTSTADRQKSALKFVCEDRDRSTTHSERDSSDHGGDGKCRFGPLLKSPITGTRASIKKWAMQYGSLANGKTLFTKHPGGRAADLTILDTSSDDASEDDDDNNNDFSDDDEEEDDDDDDGKHNVNEIEQSTPRAFDDSDSDDGNASDDEAGFDSSDGEEEDFFSSFVKQVDPPIAIRKGNRHRQLSNNAQYTEFGPSTPPRRLLPDSTDFVCGTLDEDQPLEAAFFCSKRSSVKSDMTLAYEIDPSFPDDDDDASAEEMQNLPGETARRGRQANSRDYMSTTGRPESIRDLSMRHPIRYSVRSTSPAPLANKRHRGAIDIVKSLENNNNNHNIPRSNHQSVSTSNSHHSEEDETGKIKNKPAGDQQHAVRSYDGRRGLRIRVQSDDVLHKTIREEDEYVVMDHALEQQQQTTTVMDIDSGNIPSPPREDLETTRVVSI